MIKCVSQKVLRNTALGLFMAGSMSAAAANLHKNNSYVTEPNQTELISKEGAETLKANSLQVVTQSKVPNAHHEKLDATLRKMAIDETDKKDINNMLSQVYDSTGTFLSAVYIQHDLNIRALYTFVTGNTNKLRESGVAPEFADKIDSYGEDFYKTVKPTADIVMSWVFEKYSPYLLNKLSFDHKPTAEEVMAKLDDLIKNETLYNNDDKSSIMIMSQNYKNLNLEGKKDTQSMADLIAFKINLYDTYMFFRQLVAAGIYNDGYFRRVDQNIRSFYLEWMGTVCPDRFDKINK